MYNPELERRLEEIKRIQERLAKAEEEKENDEKKADGNEVH